MIVPDEQAAGLGDRSYEDIANLVNEETGSLFTGKLTLGDKCSIAFSQTHDDACSGVPSFL